MPTLSKITEIEDINIRNEICKKLLGIDSETLNALINYNAQFEKQNIERIIATLFFVNLRANCNHMIPFKGSNSDIPFTLWFGFNEFKDDKTKNDLNKLLTAIQKFLEVNPCDNFEVIKKNIGLIRKSKSSSSRSVPVMKLSELKNFIENLFENDEDDIKILDYIKTELLPHNIWEAESHKKAKTSEVDSEVPHLFREEVSQPKSEQETYFYQGENFDLKYVHKKKTALFIPGNTIHQKLFGEHKNAEIKYGLYAGNIIVANIGFIISLGNKSYFIDFPLEYIETYYSKDSTIKGELIRIFNEAFPAKKYSEKSTPQKDKHSELALYEYIISEIFINNIKEKLQAWMKKNNLNSDPEVKINLIILDIHSSLKMCSTCAATTYGISKSQKSPFLKKFYESFKETYKIKEDKLRMICRYSFSRDNSNSKPISIYASQLLTDIEDAELKDVKTEYKNLIILHAKKTTLTYTKSKMCLFFSGSKNGANQIGSPNYAETTALDKTPNLQVVAATSLSMDLNAASSSHTPEYPVAGLLSSRGLLSSSSISSSSAYEKNRLLTPQIQPTATTGMDVDEEIYELESDEEPVSDTSSEGNLYVTDSHVSSPIP